jgi:glycine/D-amino acid oxidase-like deaminating enzyme
VECGGLLAARAILCQGHRAMDSPWFGWLPFQPAKGEILTLETDAPLPQAVLNAGRWLLPLVAGRFRFGATYDWTTRDQEPSTGGRETLLKDLPEIIRLPDARLVAHRAGVRPAALDNAPIVGPHPEHPNLWIFNGFGSKGALQIPGYAASLADHLEGGGALPKRVDVRRYADQAR